MIIGFQLLLINVSCVTEKDNEYYPEIYLDDCSYVEYNPGPIKTFFPKNIDYNKNYGLVGKTYKMNKVKELKNDSTLWAAPAKLVNLIDFEPKK